jgi:hypothetical protein
VCRPSGAAGLDATVQGQEFGDERVDDRSAPAFDHGPAVAMGHRSEEARERARERRGERQHGVGGGARHHRTPRFGAEGPCRPPCRGESPQRERRRRSGVSRHRSHRAKERRQDPIQVAYERVRASCPPDVVGDDVQVTREALGDRIPHGAGVGKPVHEHHGGPATFAALGHHQRKPGTAHSATGDHGAK